jgi:hypothetical protein
MKVEAAGMAERSSVPFADGFAELAPAGDSQRARFALGWLSRSPAVSAEFGDGAGEHVLDQEPFGSAGQACGQARPPLGTPSAGMTAGLGERLAQWRPW